MGYTAGVKRPVLGGLQVRASLQAYPSYASRRGTRLFDAFDHVASQREHKLPRSMGPFLLQVQIRNAPR